MAQISLAIIGCGAYIGAHLEVLPQVPEFQVVALVDPALGQTKACQERWFPTQPVAHFADHSEMLRQMKPEAVIVSTPHAWHFRHCLDALAAGAHVLVDKPMVTNSDDARTLVEFAKTQDRALLVAAQGFYFDTFAYARRLIADGALGQPQVISGLMASGWMKYGVNTWRQDPHLSGGGNLHDSAVHVLGAMLALANSPVQEVCCWTERKQLPVDVNAVVLLRFANGILATLANDGNCECWDSHVHYQGQRGFLRLNPYSGDFTLRLCDTSSTVTAVPADWPTPSVTPLRNFADVILGLAQPRCDGLLGVAVSDVLEILYESARNETPVKMIRTAPSEWCGSETRPQRDAGGNHPTAAWKK